MFGGLGNASGKTVYMYMLETTYVKKNVKSGFLNFCFCAKILWPVLYLCQQKPYLCTTIYYSCRLATWVSSRQGMLKIWVRVSLGTIFFIWGIVYNDR